MEVILASASPRRLALLRQVGVEPIVKVSHIEEVSSAATPQELVKENALLKGRAVCRTSSRGDLVVAADTVVALDGTVLGKPASPEEAMEMLRMLSGRTHQVHTGLAVFYGGIRPVDHRSPVGVPPESAGEKRRDDPALYRYGRTGRQGRSLRDPGHRRPVHPLHQRVLQQCRGPAACFIICSL